ncbi:SDR family NAD(P)-dependent oxidoreductase [Micromonospora tulbaghiae]|uniref:SDR family NAD(P)-dependent oxidoreductase n=1 Tax=Micromonospora tulbaghiae TaxID=479978 RepID=UPI0033C82780
MADVQSRFRLTHDDFVMRNHRLHEVSVLPGVVFFDLVYRTAVAAGWDHRRLCVRDTVLAEAIVTTDGFDREVVLTIGEQRDAGRPFTVRSRWLRGDDPVSGWHDNAHGLVCFTDEPVPPPLDLAALRAAADRHDDVDVLYQRAVRENIRHGPAMRCRGTLHIGGGALLADLTREQHPGATAAGFHLHPASLDASTLAGFGQVEMPTDDPFVPMFVREFRAPEALPPTCHVHVPRPERLAPSGDVITTDYTIRDEHGRFLAGFTGLTCKRIRESGLVRRLLADVSADAAPVRPATGASAMAPGQPAASPPGAANGFTDTLRAAVADMLGRPPAEVATGAGFYDLGFDSVALLRLTERVEHLVGRKLYPTLLFEHTTIDALAAHLSTGPAPAVPPSPDAPVADAAPAPAVPEPAVLSFVDAWVPADPAPPAARTPEALVVGGVLPAGLAAAHVDSVDRLRDVPDLPPAVVLLSGDPAADLWRAATALVDAGPRDLLVVHAGEPTAEQAATAALARTVTAEVPGLRCRFVQVEHARDLAAAVRAELRAADAEPEVRYVGGRRLVRRWREVDLAVEATGGEPFRDGGVYLVTGGSGGLAAVLATHLARRHRARIALLSRTAPAAALVDRCRAAGAEVHVAIADVTDAAAVDAAVAGVRERFGRIDGVLHCAGVTRDGLFFRGDPGDLAAVAAAKLDGLRHVDAATAGDALDFLVAFSSASADVANPGQAAYAYANAGLRHVGRRGRGRTVVIGWPYWAEGGMRAPADALRRSTERTGQEPMPTGTALGVLRDVLRGPYDAVLVLHGQADRLRELVPAAGEAAGESVTVPGPAVLSDRGPAVGDSAVGEPADDPVAVVGVAGRYPGADDLDAFWRNLAGGVDAITEVPAGRWDHAALFDPEKGTPGRTYGRWGGFLDGVDRFAPAFFGVSRRDAERMDPQERLFLTTCWHALENAGHPPESLRGEVVGVYAGVMWNHYQLVGGATDGVAPTAMHCAIANRVSHTFDLTGPSLAVDTACSSSLTAVHLAVESIRRGECTLALAGGVNVTVHPQKYLQLAQGQWLSTDGRCRAFGADGTGYVPGEGVGAVLLKPLSRALADGDHVYGVIRATSVNHTGRTAGATVPSPGSQAALVRAALESAGWTPATVGYVEAHGTGTALGDPIEVEGLRQAFDGADLPAGACAIGSVKSNIGHLEGAAGIAGLTKVLLQLRHRALVPSLHAEELNPHIDFAAVPLRVQRTLEPWTPPPGVPRRAGVSAFGAGGTNAHVLVEEFAPAAAPAPDGPALVVLSAPTAGTLRAYAGAMAAGLPASTGPTAAVADLLGVPEEALEPSATLGDLGLDPARLADLVGVEAIGRLSVATRLDELAGDRGVRDIAYTTQVGRAPQAVRVAVVTSGTDALRTALERFARGEDTADVVTAGAPATGDPVAAFRAGDLHEVARHWVGGGAVDWFACYPDGHPRRVPLPTCPLPEEPCWLGGWDAARAGTPVDGTPVAGTAGTPVTRADAHVADAGAAGTQAARTGSVDAVRAGTGGEVRSAASPPPAADGDVVVPDGPELEFRVLDQGVALVSMRAPMFTDGLLAALGDTFAEIERRDDVRAVVITGHGSVFSMGGTPEALRALAEGEGTFTDAALVYEGILRCTRPVVTAAAGHASGGGLAFACYGDVVVLGDTSVYSANFTRYGFTPGMGATYILEQRLGPALAAEMMLTGRSMTGAELSRRGAGVTVLPPHEVVPAALDLARSMADKPPAVIRSLKNELAGRILDRLPDVIASEVRMHGNVLGAESAALVREHFTKVGEFRSRATPAAQPEPGPDDGTVSDAVTEIVGALLYLRPDEVLPSRTFADLGLDSIGAVELVRDLNRRFGTDLDSAAVYDHPTVPDLARAVRRNLAESASLRAQATAPPAPSVVDEPVPPAAGPPPLVLTAPAAAPGSAPTPGNAPATASEPPPLTFAVRPPSVSPSHAEPAPTGTPASAATPLPASTAGPAAAAAPAPDTSPDAPTAIAVIGMAGRFPDAPDLDTFWDNLAAGRSAIREVSRDRWDLTELYDPDPAVPGRTRSRWAALLDDVDAFDAGLFRVSPLEAEAMDPQQRIFLEQAWAALEDAGYAGRPMRCGVFVGCGAGDYPRLLERHGRGDTSEAFLGGASSILPARIAYLLDLTGPTMAIDTACSSSLTAVHLACESLRSGDCDTALAGGVAVMCTPQMQVWTSQTGMLSPTGRCLPFDAAADGIVLGEGVGVVVLKRLDRALADGDHVHGVILAGGVNGDGRTNGITAPSAVSQVRLLREVHARAGVEVGYVETHGTGTALGDPIEVKALAQVVGPHCRIGSVKANIGHTTMAAGVAGLIKVLLSLRHRQLPPTPHATEPIPGLPVVRELTGWHDDRLVAGVSSFGFSGTNCHLVVAEAPAPSASTGTGPVVVPVSARTASALRDLTDRLAERLRTEPADVQDVAVTLARGRAHLAVRAAFVASDTADLVRQLAGGPPAPDAPNDLVALAERWVAGADVDWTAMPAGRRVPLPTYPFARDRFWTGRDRRETALTPADPLVADHTLHGVPVLPGAAFLRQATAGGSARAADVTWLRPVVVTGPVTAVVTRDDRITLTVGGAPHAVATRRAADPVPPGRVDLASVEARCPGRRPVDDLYAGFARAGLRYGPSFRVLTELRLGAGEALGTLTADGEVQLLDGALQAIAGVADPADRMLVPFAVESAFVADRLPTTARVHVVGRDGGRFDVVVTDLTGDVRARLDGVALRPYDPSGATPSGAESPPVVPAPPAAGEPDLLYVPAWRPAGAPSGAPPAGRVLAVHTPGDAALAAALGADDTLPLGELPTGRYDTVYVLARTADPAAPPHDDTATLDAFRLLRRLLDLGADRGPLTLTLVVSGVAGLPGEPVHPHAAGLAGLASAIAAEYPQWRVTCVDAGPGDTTPAEAIRREHGTDRFVALRGDSRLVRRLEPVAGPAGAAPLRDGGVYLVVGGTGGIGFEVSRHLARTRRARLVWLGRSPEDERIRSLVTQIEALGGQAVYLRADVTDAVAVRRAVAEARQRFGPVDGAFHAALVLRDRALSAMDEAAFTEVLRPKVAGVGVLADALAGEPLDFLALFSSALSFAPAPGQANYAAASTFEDAYGLALHRRGQPVRVVNWGWWGSVGVVADPGYAARFAALGIGSIEPAEGVAALERILAGPHPQVAVLKGTRDGLAALGVHPSAPAADAAVTAVSGPPATGGAAGDTDPSLDRSSAAFRTLDGLARDLLRDRLRDRPAPASGPLAAAVAAAVSAPPAGLSTVGVLARHPDLAPHVALLARCVDALPGVLDGRTSPTEVLFPGGSTDLVAAVYRGQRAADFYHRLVAAEAAAVLDRTDGPGRVLEIGAGTGAGSAFVLDACPGVRYDFTDLSTAFLREAEDRFGGRHPGLRFGVLDIEREPDEQGFAAGSYDVVLATNVLHATADVVRSLRHARSLLRPGGVLLLNEVTRASDFLTATFGLLPGWWRFTDAHRRLPHSPLLSPAGWRAALAEAGLTGRILGMPGVPGDEQEQCVLVATAGAPPVDRVPVRAARDYVRAVFAEVLKYRPDQLDDDVTFDNFGVDSLVGQHLVRRFSADLGDLPATLLFEHLTIEQLADHLARERPGPLAAVLGAAAVEAVPAPVHAAEPERPAAPVAPAVPAAPALAARGDADAIAVVGLAGRYPGAPDLERFWQNLVTGTTSISEVPPERWDWREHFDPRRGRPGHTYSRWAGFLTDVDRFDPGFFGILPKDAAAMDPQERLFLETVWLMLEDAGALGGVLPGDTGVFVGTMYGSYGRIAAAQGWPEGRYTDGHSAYWSIANRVSYTLDLTGPSFAVDSACSSSLTAVHLACESLRRGECSAAVAGGVNLVLHPAHLIALSSMTMLSADGACKVFDERADGFVPGEGVGAVLLKPLSAALRDGDRIWGVIEGGFVNAGGRTAGYTVPNPTAQADLVVRALAAAGVTPGDVGYLEAHGTGTALGDPIEIAGLGRALGAGLPDGRRIPVGSVKANIGHLEGAAGIAGLTKVLLQLAHGTIAPCANLSTVNSRIDLSGSFLLPTSAQPWTAPRRAGVSSFGAGGANAHLVVREHPAPSPSPAPVRPGPHVVVLSARTPEQLRTLTAAVADLVERTRPRLDQLAYSTQVGRAEFDHRLAVVVSDIDELVRRLRAGEVTTGTAGTDPLFDGDGGAEIAADLLRRGRLDQSAKLWVRGVPVDWAGRWPVRPGRVSLPPYPFDRQRLWLPEPAGTARPPAPPSVPDGDRTADRRDAESPSPAVPEALARANAVPEAAVPENAVPVKTVPGSVAPETAARETGVPGTGVPETGVPGTGAPESDPCVYLRPQWRAEPPPQGGRPPARIRVVGEGPTFGGRHDQADPDVVVVHLPARAGGLADEVRESLHTVLRTAVEVLTPDPAAPLRIVVGCPDERPAYTAVTAALRTLALEHSGFSGAVVRGGVTAEADLWHVSGPPEQRVDDVRWSGGVREVRRMVPFRPGPAVRRTGGVYVVVGGTGAVGRHLAVHLAVTRAPSAVVLVGRTAPADDTFAFVRADVTVESDVRGAVAEIRRRYGRIDGVVHAAGVHDDARALTKPAAAVDAVLAPKVLGLRHLVDALGPEPLEFLALCSSIAGRTGNLGQVDYAYANAFLDEFAAGRPGTVSVCWPLWADGGMAVDDATRRLFARRWGSAPLPTAEAVRAFDRVVSGTEPVVAVQRPADVAPEVPQSGPDPELDLDAELRALAAGFLLVEPDEVDPDIQLLDLGFDSISLTGLVNETNERFGVDLLPTVLYEHPTLAAFGAYLRTVLPARPAPAAVDARLAADRPGADAAEPAADLPADAVAVVGMAGVLPGSPDLDAFWRHLAAGDDLVRPVPADRTDLLADPATAGVRAGFLDDVRSFDADLFGIAPREAALMDPQQRLFLQTAWQAVADAGYRPADLAGTDTGIFVGVSACDYDDLLRAHDVPVEAHTASGLADCILANRVSYLLDLRGPSEAVDTACSSSLVAVHRAVRALLAGECSTALAGGVNVLLSPGLFVAFQSSGMLSADGRCKTFDASADGYGRGEGCGVVLLKPLRAAVADGDQVIAVIRGSAVNHAGRGPSLTAPNPQAQAQVVSRAYRAGGVDPADVSYIEAHGTGTRLGDPIEIEGLKKAFEGVDATIAVGTVKTNIGHLEAAAGIAGLLKVLLSLRHGRLPRTLHQHRRNPYLRLDGTPFTVLDRDVPWTGDRVAGVSSFGFGGTNAHVVVQSPPPLPASPAPGPWRLVLSASGPAALAEYRRRVADHLAEGADLARATYTLQVGRDALAHRFAAVVADPAEAVAVLRGDAPARLDAETEAWLAGGDVDWAATWEHRPARISVPAPPLAARPFWFDEGPARAAAPSRPAPAEPPAPHVPAERPAPVRRTAADRIVLRDPSALRRNGAGRRASAGAGAVNGGHTPNGAAPVGVLARPASRPAGAGPAATAPPAAAAPPAAPARTSPAQPHEHVDRPDPADPRGLVEPHGPAEQPRRAGRPAAAVVAQEPAGTVPAAPAEVAEAVRDCVARVLGADRTEITADRAFADLGLDSIFRMELARLVVATFDVEITAADLYEHDTVEAVAALVAAGTRAPRPATPGDGVEEIVAGVLERPVEPGRTFADSGLTSFDMLRVVGALEQRYGALPKTLLFDHPTMADLTAFLAGRSAGTGVRTEPGDGPRATGRTIESGAEVDGEPVVVRKRTLPGRPALRDLLADLDRRHAKEGGLAGRDIAPYAFVDSERAGYVNFSVRGDDVFAWSFVGHHDHFHDLVAEWIAWARRHGLRPNFLSLAHLTEVAGEPVTATPFGAVQRLTDLASFTVRGGRMQRLRSLLHRFERAGDCRIEEYRAGASPETDQQIVGLIDSWGRRKQMVNPYVGVVREEIGGGTLDPRHRVFLTRVDDVLVNAVIVTRIPSERGYLLDLEFYADEMPAGGLEWAIVRIIELTAAEGCTSFSFGASFGVAITESPNADPAVADALAELHSVGVFGPGNFQFKNKFRPENTPIYLCQPATGDRTSVTDIILMIANPDLVDGAPAGPAPSSDAAAATPPRATAPPESAVPSGAAAPPADAGPPPDPALRPGRADLLAAHGYNALALPTELVPFDLLTDSWAERADGFVAARTRLLAERPAPPELTAHDWLPMPEVVPTRSGRAAEELLCRCHPGPRGVVLHAAAFPTWLSTLADLGYEPVAVGIGRLDPETIEAFAAELTRRTPGSVSFVVVEAASNAAGGVPVEPAALRELRRVTAAHGVPLVLDASRVVDNAVRLAGPGGDPWTVVRDMLAVADTATLSLSKDFGVTAGGLVATRDPELAARLREHVARRGAEVDRATRMTLRAALADRDGVTELVRRRVAAVAVLRDGLRAAGLPVVDVDGAHCVLLDLARMPGLAGQEHPTMSGLAWLYTGAGVRGGPHLAVGGPLAGTVRLAVPVGFGPDDAEAVVAAVAALAAAPGEVPELVTGGIRTAGEAARAVYQPADRVPEDVRQALRDQAPADDNGTVLREHQPAVRWRVVPVAGAQVEVFTAGDGPPLLLAHPFNIGAGVFARQFKALAGRYRVISVHHPGVGASTASADLTLDGIAALQQRVLREIGVDGPVHVAGASFGGLVALTFALNHPEDTASLILLGSSYKIGNRVGEINRLAVVAAQDLDRTIEGSGADRLRHERAAVEALLLRCESMDPQTGLRYLDVFAARPDLRARLGELDLPALVVQGRHDTVIPSETARLLHQGIRGARYEEIADAGHFPYLTSPQECNRILTDFLRGAGGEGS